MKVILRMSRYPAKINGKLFGKITYASKKFYSSNSFYALAWRCYHLYGMPKNT